MVAGVASRRWTFGCAPSPVTPTSTRTVSTPRTIPTSRGLFEEIVEGFLGARLAVGGRGGLGLALDRGPHLEEGALVPRVLRRNARRHGLAALERRARIEVRALGAAMQIGLAARALAGRAPRGRHGELGAAADALHHFPEA